MSLPQGLWCAIAWQYGLFYLFLQKNVGFSLSQAGKLSAEDYQNKMKIALLILVAFLAFAICVWLLSLLLKGIRRWMIATGRHPWPECSPDAAEWKPTYHLEHLPLTLFHIPFEPDRNEVFYLENEYDAEANRFIQENKELITQKFAGKGFRFVYLPDIQFPEEDLVRYILYREPSITEEEARERIANQPPGQDSTMLLDYMVFTKKREQVRSCFAWFNYRMTTHHDSHRIRKYVFDFIRFDGTEALSSPEAVLDEICQELGRGRNWIGGMACTQQRNREEEEADERFSYDIQQLLEEVRQKVDTLRTKGVSDAIISRYVRRTDAPGRLRITEDLRIFLPDYQDKEVRLEPLNKTVFLFFLRHEEGFRFKELSEHARELSAIYQSVKQRKNEIGKLMGDSIPIPKNIEELTNPLSNSINEKCTRIKEAFLLLMHEDIACHYYINGPRSEKKRIKLSRKLVEWEGGER